ncbi:unnamed protein product, partial [Trichobilharzia szidati]
MNSLNVLNHLTFMHLIWWLVTCSQTDTIISHNFPVIVSSNCRSLPNKIMNPQSLLSSDTYHNT